MASFLHSPWVLPPLSTHNPHLSSPRSSIPCLCHNPRSLPPNRKPRHLLSHPISLSFLSATTNGSSLSALLPPTPSRLSQRAGTRSAAVIRAAFIFDWITRIFKFFTDTPVKLFAERLEADLNKAAKLVKTGATVIIHIAEETEEFAEQLDKISEQVQEVAEKVSDTSEVIHKQVVDVLDVIEGEKSLVITSYKIVDNKEITTQAVASTSSAGGSQPIIAVESIIKEASTEKSNEP